MKKKALKRQLKGMEEAVFLLLQHKNKTMDTVSDLYDRIVRAERSERITIEELDKIDERIRRIEASL